MRVIPSKTEVLVVGSGYAGYSAAIEARLAGVIFLVIEKMAVPGGNSIISDGGIAVGTWEQSEQGIEDSVQLMVADMRKAALYRSDLQLVSVVCENSKDAYQWTKDLFDMQYHPKI